MQGMMLKDAAVVHEIDASGRFIRARFTNDGKFYQTTNAKTPTEFNQLIEYVREIFRSIGAKMLDGEISARPYKKDDNRTGCTFCEFKSVCGFEPDSKNWLTVPDWKDADAIKEIERRLKTGGDEHGRQ